MADTERSLNALLDLGREQTEASTHVAQGLGQLVTCILAQQHKIRAMEERMDAMREMILGLEHTAANPIVVDKDETVVEAGSSSGKELEIEENEVAVPIPVCHRHGRLCDYRSTLSFYFAKSNSFPTLVDLIFPLILSIHVIVILSYPYVFTFTLTHSLSFFQMRGLLL